MDELVGQLDVGHGVLVAIAWELHSLRVLAAQAMLRVAQPAPERPRWRQRLGTAAGVVAVLLGAFAPKVGV